MEVKELDFVIDPATMTGGVGEEFESPQPRSAGLHQGEVIRDIENAVLKPGERRPYDQLTSAEKQRMGNYVEMGFIWEVVVESVWKRRMFSRRKAEGVIRQPELLVDGLYRTLDGIIIPAYSLDEYKATWKSSNHPIDGPSFWAWHQQMMGNLHAISVTFGVKARQADLYVFYVNGDYRESGPQTKHFVFTFADRELAESVSMINRHAAKMKANRRIWDSKPARGKGGA